MNQKIEIPESPRTLKNLVNTPFKRIMFGVQILSWILIVASPVIGGLLRKWLQLTGLQTGGVILGIFITGEVLFYGSLAFLGKELMLILKDKFKLWFKRRNAN